MEGANLLDPLRQGKLDPARILFERMAPLVDGFDHDAVVGAAGNLIINALRQSQPTRTDAMSKFSMLMDRIGKVLVSHYDSVSGRRKNIFPFTQHIELSHLIDKDR